MPREHHHSKRCGIYTHIAWHDIKKILLQKIISQSGYVSTTDWPTHKSEIPLGQVPVLEIDGFQLPQSVSIERYVTKQAKLYSTDDFEAAKTDSVIDTIDELRDANLYKIILKQMDEKLVEKRERNLLEEDVPKVFTKLEILIKNYGSDGRFFLGNKLTWADLCCYEQIIRILKLDPEILNKYPKLALNHEHVEKEPTLAEYIKTPPEASF
ncbi:unnamed protein product [Didymodactylos carnosus]|uniref:Glutathione S-transferase n=1 Tax=Didymodactylos carnosus TaxID=1234261 RepID=A0A815AFV9_9BILA|nr:unnamed protein product [Didymodactylos carnosus]CAF4027371.1 unnamed protein product [Didymodactylos carnosus]